MQDEAFVDMMKSLSDCNGILDADNFAFVTSDDDTRFYFVFLVDETLYKTEFDREDLTELAASLLKCISV